MNSSTYFRDWLNSIYKPCALVYSSEKAKKVINKNNISPAEFLRPLGDFQGRQISFPFNDKENISIPNFHFDFYDNDKFKKIESSKIIQYITTMYDYNQPNWDLSSPTVSKQNLEPYLNNTKYNSTIWYREFEKTIFECVQFDDYELLQQPLINIFICCLDEPISIINENLCKNVPKIIFDGRYDTPKESIIILISEKNSTNSENKNEENEKEKDKDKDKSGTETDNSNINNYDKEINRFKSFFKKYHIIHWEINRNKSNNLTNRIYRKYLHRTDLYNPDNDFYRKSDVILGEYISNNDIVEYKEDFFKYITNNLLNRLLEQINEYNNIIKQKKGGFKNFFKSSNKNVDTFYSNTNIYKFNEVERCYYNLGLIFFHLRLYNYSLENFKSFSKLIKEKSENHRNRVQELLTIIKFLLTLNTKKEFEVSNEIKKLKDYTMEQDIKVELLAIKMLENGLGDVINIHFLNLVKNSIFAFITKNKQKYSNKNSLTCLDYVIPILYEKICIFLLKSNEIRNFAFYITFVGKYFNCLYKEMKPYVLYSFSQLLFVIDNPNKSFINFREYFNNKLGMACNEIKYYEGGLKFFRNCLEFSYLDESMANNTKMQNIYLNFYLSDVSKILQENIICDKININDVIVPLIDNRSLFILEEDDYKIKKISESIFESERSWKEYFKYKFKLFGDPYNDLDDTDLNHVELLEYISNSLNKSKSNITTKASLFHGNIKQKLYVQFTISNPLSIDLIISSIKLLCEFIPEIEDDVNNENPYICNEEKLTLKRFESLDMTLNVQGLAPGKIIIKGLELVLFKDCKIVHYFNKKNKKKLYSHRKKSLSSQENDTSTDLNSSDISNKFNKSFTEKDKEKVYTKRIIEYTVKDYSDDLYVSFPMGREISLYLYEFLLFPIVLTNNSDKNRVKRFTLFIENCSNQKVQPFFSYITKEIHLNKDNPTTTVYIPILPIFRDDVYIKLLIKFSDEKRIKPIKAKFYIIKINVKRSIFFEFNETCYNFFSDKSKKIDVNLKTDLSLKNNEELSDLTLKEPILNKKYTLLNKKSNETNDNKIHMNFYFERNNDYVEEVVKEEDEEENEVERIKKRDYSEMIKNFAFFVQDKNNMDIQIKNNHIYEKLNEMIKKANSNVIIFPWEAKLVKNNEKEENKIESNTNNGDKLNSEDIHNEKTSIRGIYVYNLKLKNPNISKNYIRELFYNSTKLEPVVKKINKDKSLIIINISINKTGLIPLGKDIDKYDIFIDETTPLITWFGPNRITVRNHIDNEGDNISHCRFTFYTNQKGLLEVNRICVLLYKRFEGMEFSTGIIQINHITKPLYLEIE